MRSPAPSVLGAVAATVLLLAGCGSPSTTSSNAEDGSTGGATGSITVLAAASLTESFTTLADQFEATHPGTTVMVSFGASSALAAQIIQGAPADVFASASTTNMDQVVSAGAADAPVPFAHNILEIAVPPGNPGKVTGLADLARSDVSVALCATSVPCGSLAHTIADRAGLTVTPVTEEPTVKAVLTKVELGEVDAGVVFVTDVRTAGDKVVGVPIPEEANEATTYPIVTLDDAANAALADEFLAYVLSSDGQAVLAGVGFTSP